MNTDRFAVIEVEAFDGPVFKVMEAHCNTMVGDHLDYEGLLATVIGVFNSKEDATAWTNEFQLGPRWQ